MTLEIDVASVQSNLANMLAAANNGDEVLIVENKHPVAQLIPVKNNSAESEKEEPQQKERIIGLMKGQIWIADDFDAPLDDFSEYM